ncbi:MAG: ABC transporter permease subunit [Acholeplasmatales bacterium]|nr:ABC transporter permease subunit [Acholeplasmatales bacterium]
MISTTTSKKIKNLILFVAGILIILLLISLIGLIKDNPIVFPSVLDIFKSFFKLLGDGNTYKYIGITILDFIIVIIASSIIGIGLGILSGFSDISNGLLKPFMIVARSMPMVIIIVIIMLTVPNDNYRYVPIVSTAIALIPILYESVSEGIRRIDSTYNDVWRLNSKLNFKVITNVHLPLISGYLKQAFITAIGLGIKMIVTTEFIAGVRNTLGIAIFDAKTLVEYSEIYAYGLLLVIIVVIAEWLPFGIIKLVKYIISKNKKNNKTSETNPIE